MFQLKLQHGILHLLCTPECFIVVDFTGGRYNLRFHGKFCRNEIRVNRDTVSSNTTTRLKDINTRMLVRQFYQFPNIDSCFITNQRKLISKSYLYITGGIFCQFTHFCRFAVGAMKHSLHKPAIKFDSFICRSFIHTANDTIIMNQFINYITGKDTFRTIGYINFIF